MSPLGFHESTVLRLLQEYRVSRRDRIVVLTCKPLVGGVKRAYESLRALCTTQGFPDPDLVELECSSFYQSFRAVYSRLLDLDAEEDVLEVGAGLRILGYTAMLALLRLGRPFKVHYEPEAGSLNPQEIPWEFIEVVIRGLSPSEADILEIVLGSPGITIGEIASVTGRKEKSVRNIVSQLRKKGLIDKRGRSENLYPTQRATALYPEKSRS